MKKLLMVLMCLVLSIGTASAQGWHRGGWSHDYHRGYYRGYHGGDRGRDLVAGLIVGSLITAAVVDRPRPYYPPQTTYIVEQPASYTLQRVPVYCVDGYGRQYICEYQMVRVYDQP